MSNIRRYIPRIILLDVLLLTILNALASALLNAFGLVFRKWMIILFLAVIVVGVFGGVIQLLLKIKWKVLRILLICGFVAITVRAGRAAAPFVLFAFADEEYVVERDGSKYVAHVIGFYDTYVEYHEYKGPFVESAGVRIQEYYGEGSFDPIGGDREYPVLRTVYYGEAGNEVVVE